MTNDKFISRSDIKFWIPIISMAVSVTVAITTINNKVEAMIDREQTNKATFVQVVDTLNEVRDGVIKLQKDVEYIKLRL